jgi:DNA-binding MarR family transcriptional regulator
MNDTPDSVSREAFHRLLLLFRYLRQHARQMKGQGISPRDFSVLRFLLESGPATIGGVQDFIYRSASTASALVDKLEGRGYVTRTRSETDNRVVIVELTPAGRDVALCTPLQGLPLLRRKLDALPRERLTVINTALGEIMQLMEVGDQE